MSAEHTLLPGDTLLTQSDGTPIRFDSLVDLSVGANVVGLVKMPDGSQCLAGNMKDIGPMALRASDRHRYLLAPDKFCVTALRDIKRPLGKVFDTEGNKSANAWVNCALARTVRCETHDDLAALIEEVGADRHAAVILDSFKGMAVGAEFLILSEAELRKRLQQPEANRAQLLGIHVVEHKGRRIPAVIRFKENFQPSVWLAIDRDVDEHTSPAFAQMSDAEYFAALSKALPGVDRVTRVRTLSSSARAERAGVPLGRNAGHTLIQLADPTVKDRLRAAYRSRAMVTGTAWTVPKHSKDASSKVVARGWKCLADDATFGVGRLLFCGSPVSQCSDIVIRPQQCVVEPRPDAVFDGHAVAPASVEALRSVTGAAGCPVTLSQRDGGALAFDEHSLTLDINVETERNGVLTIRDAMALLAAKGAPEKLRCQAPFRESSSFAAFLRLIAGEPVLHDMGTATTYRLTPADSALLDFGDPDDESATAAQHSPNAVAPELPRGQRRPLRVLSPAELRSLPPVAWRIQGVLPKTGLAVLYGPSGAGKSFVVMSMSMAIARGVDWHGRSVQPAGVLYVAAEGSSGFPGRLAAYAKHHACSLDEVPFWLVPEAIDLMGKDDPQLIIDAACSRTDPVGVIVLDTLNRSMSGDENAAADMTKVIGAAGKIASATGALVLIVTHTGKNEALGARGHSSLRAAADAEFYVHGTGDIRTIKVTKMRDGSDQLQLAFRLELVEVDEDGASATPASVPVALPVSLGNSSGRSPVRPGTWDGVVLDAHNTAVDNFEDMEAGVPTDVLLKYVPDAYRKAKGSEPPQRWRDSATRSLATLVTAGLLRREGAYVTRTVH